MDREDAPHVVVLEDERFLLDVVQRFLVRSGYRVSAYTSLEAALEDVPALSEHPPAILMVDGPLLPFTGRLLDALRAISPDIMLVPASDVVNLLAES